MLETINGVYCPLNGKRVQINPQALQGELVFGINATATEGVRVGQDGYNNGHPLACGLCSLCSPYLLGNYPEMGANVIIPNGQIPTNCNSLP
jgi:hypothetical protein